MGRETILFKTEEKMTRTMAADLLRQIADKLDVGKVKLLQGNQKAVVLKVPKQVEVEIKAEKEVGKRKTKKKLEVEVEWIVGGQQDKGAFSLG